MTKDDFLKDQLETITFPIQWSDMDAFSHVNNIEYFRFFENVRIAFFRRTNIIKTENHLQGIGPIMKSTECRFKAPVTFPDTLIAGTKISEVKDTEFTMDYTLWSEKLDRVVPRGSGVIVSYDYDNNTKTKIPDPWLKFF